jgi:DNA primase
MAAEMISDQHRLSKSNEQMIVKDEERLHELIPHLLIDFKLAILEEDRKQTMQQLGLPEVLNNQQKTKEVMEHYKKLTDTLKELAKRAGDRVILKA